MDFKHTKEVAQRAARIYSPIPKAREIAAESKHAKLDVEDIYRLESIKQSLSSIGFFLLLLIQGDKKQSKEQYPSSHYFVPGNWR